MSTSRCCLGWRPAGYVLIATVALCGNALGQWGGSSSNSGSYNPRMNNHGDSRSPNNTADLLFGIGSLAETKIKGAQAVIDGKELDPTWKDRLKLAVGDAIKKDPMLKTVVAPDAFVKLVENLGKTSTANAALQQSDNGTNGGGLLPSGNTQLVLRSGKQ